MKEKNIIKSISFLVIITVTLLVMGSSNEKANAEGTYSLSNLIHISNAIAECRTPTWWYGPCNQRVESIQSSCTRTEIHRTYYDTNNEICGTAVSTGGIFTLTSGYATGEYQDETTTETYTATRVNCPTDGNNNDCEEYDPC